MPRHSYRERDYAFGQAMLTLRTSIGLTQAGLADLLRVSRRAVAEWEGGSNYPKEQHLQHFIAVCVQQHDRRTIALSSFSVADIQDAGIDLFQRTEGRARPVPHHTCHLSAMTFRPKCAMLLG